MSESEARAKLQHFVMRTVEAEEEVRRLRDRMQWQPIETAPKDGRRVLVYEPYEPAMCWAWWCEDQWLPSHGAYPLFAQPTHWIDLQEPAE